MAIQQTACPSCSLLTPAWRLDCIHCGFVRKQNINYLTPAVHLRVATIGRTYPAGTRPEE